MKIAIMSDSHDNWANLRQAVKQANQETCQVLLFAGDLISPNGIEILASFKGQVYVVWGNNEGEIVKLTRLMDQSENITLAGEMLEHQFEGVRVFMGHYPRPAELAALSHQVDVSIHGHTHLSRQEQIEDTLLINPGAIAGDRGESSQFAIYDTTSRTVTMVKVTLH